MSQYVLKLSKADRTRAENISNQIISWAEQVINDTSMEITARKFNFLQQLQKKRDKEHIKLIKGAMLIFCSVLIRNWT